MKFKIGDKVEVIANTTDCKEKNKYINCIFTIGSLNPNPAQHKEHYGVKENYDYIFYDDELISAFFKSDLKDGMVVELKNGYRGIVIHNLIVGEDFYIQLSNYNYSLIVNYNNSIVNGLNIIKVYNALSYKGFKNYIKDENLTLIWERENPRKMRKEEIEEELGYKIEII